MAKGSVTEVKPGTYRLRVDAGPDPATGKRRQVSKVVHGGKREADRALRQLMNEVESGIERNTKQTVADLTTEWLDQKRRTLSPKSIEYYEDALRIYLLPSLGARKVATLTARDLDGLYRALEAKGVSPHGIRKAHATIRAALSQAVKWQMVATNVALAASPPSLPKRDPRSMSPEDVAAVIDRTTKDYGANLARFFTLAALTGARRGEILGLRVSDLDTATNRLRITRSVIATKGKAFVKSTKTGQTRYVSLDETSLEILKAEIGDQEEGASHGRFIRVEDPYIFASDPTGAKSLHPDWPSHVFAAVAKTLNLPYHLHELRHFSATQLISAGVDLRTVAGRLGHADPGITMRIYAHVVEAKDREAADIMGRILDVSSQRGRTAGD